MLHAVAGDGTGGVGSIKGFCAALGFRFASGSVAKRRSCAAAAAPADAGCKKWVVHPSVGWTTVWFLFYVLMF